MRIIIPMAGRGTRLRPHSLTVPKPLVSIAGKPIVQRLVEDLAALSQEKIEEIAFIIGDFGKQVEQELLDLATRLGSRGRIYYQMEQLGTAHAILCAQEMLDGPVIVAFADTLFRANTPLNTDSDGAIWVQSVPDPSAYGVIKLDEEGYVKEFIEKPSVFVSDLAIIGVYYFRDAAYLKRELQYLIDQDIKEKGEYQLTNALENMRRQGAKFRSHAIEEWLDCGNKNAVLYANQRILDIKADAAQIANSVQMENSTIIHPCFIGEGVQIRNSVIGPYVSIGKDAKLENAIITRSIVQDNAIIHNVIMENSMLGNHVEYVAKKTELSLGDFSKYHQ
jgi:glucose-1-phosphate thymidylyltransferase